MSAVQAPALFRQPAGCSAWAAAGLDALAMAKAVTWVARAVVRVHKWVPVVQWALVAQWGLVVR